MQQALILNEDAFKNYSSLLHDAVCLGWNFDYQHKQLTMQLDGEDSIEKPYQITFRNVFGHEMISCDFWGPSPHLLGWSALTGEQRRLYPRYADEIDKNEYTFARLLPGEKCMEVEVLFASGDVLPSVYKGQYAWRGLKAARTVFSSSTCRQQAFVLRPCPRRLQFPGRSKGVFRRQAAFRARLDDEALLDVRRGGKRRHGRGLPRKTVLPLVH